MKEKEIERLNVLKEFEKKLYSEGLKYIAGIDDQDVDLLQVLLLLELP